MARRTDDDPGLFDDTGAPAPRRPRQASLLLGDSRAPAERPPDRPAVTYDRGVAPAPKLAPPTPAPVPEPAEPAWSRRAREAEKRLGNDAQVRFGDAWRALLRSEQWVLDFADGEALRLRRSVRQLSVHEGVVESSIVDGRGRPQRAQVRLPAFPESDWARVARHVVSENAAAAVLEAARARTLAHAFVDAADACQLTFLPRRLAQLASTCTCGGARIPCDHLVATHLALARALDDDPWVLVKARGATPELLADWMDRAAEMVAAHAPGTDAADPAHDWDYVAAPLDLTALAARRPVRAPLPAPDGHRGKESFDRMVRRLVAAAGGPE